MVVRYEVRIPSRDDDHDYYVENQTNGEFGEVQYDGKILASAKAWAKAVDGWVVKVTEETVYKPKEGDGVVPAEES